MGILNPVYGNLTPKIGPSKVIEYTLFFPILIFRMSLREILGVMDFSFKVY